MCNGYTNHATYDAYNILANDEFYYRQTRRLTSPKQLKILWELFLLDTPDISIEKINFEELYDSLTEV